MNRFYALVVEFKTKLGRNLEVEEIKLIQWMVEKEKLKDQNKKIKSS